MISGGDRAMMSPGHADQQSAAEGLHQGLVPAGADLPERGSSSMPDTRPRFRTSMTWGTPFSEWTASSQTGASSAARWNSPSRRYSSIAAGVAQFARERDEVDVDREQHQLDRHQQDDEFFRLRKMPARLMQNSAAPRTRKCPSEASRSWRALLVRGRGGLRRLPS